MKFIKIDSTKPVVEHLVHIITSKLRGGQSVLWLVPGGSSMGIAIEVAKKIKNTDLSRLSLSLSDERYGAVGHQDSNWQQLIEAGFELPGAKLQPVLNDKSLPETERFWNKFLSESLTADYKLGFIGIGADGHAAGIKPGSPAVFSKQLAVGYRGPDFVRLSITPHFIAQLDEIVSYTVGEDKWPVLEALGSDAPITTQPAQALKSVKNWTIYNDHMGTER